MDISHYNCIFMKMCVIGSLTPLNRLLCVIKFVNLKLSKWINDIGSELTSLLVRVMHEVLLSFRTPLTFFCYFVLLKCVYVVLQWLDGSIYKKIKVRGFSGGVFEARRTFEDQIKCKHLSSLCKNQALYCAIKYKTFILFETTTFCDFSQVSYLFQPITCSIPWSTRLRVTSAAPAAPNECWKE